MDVEWPKFSDCESNVYTYAEVIDFTAIMAAKQLQTVTKKNVALKFLKGIINEAPQPYQLQAQMLKTALTPMEQPLPQQFKLQHMANEIMDSKPSENDRDLIIIRHRFTKPICNLLVPPWAIFCLRLHHRNKLFDHLYRYTCRATRMKFIASMKSCIVHKGNVMVGAVVDLINRFQTHEKHLQTSFNVQCYHHM